MRHIRRTPAELENSQSTRHSRSAAASFCSCDLLCSRVECILLPSCFDLATRVGVIPVAHFLGPLLVFKETFVQTVFTVVNLAVVGLRVFYSLVLRCSWSFCSYDCLVIALSVFFTCISSWSTDTSKINPVAYHVIQQWITRVRVYCRGGSSQ